MGVYCPEPRGTWPECYASGMAACHCFQSSDGRRDPASVSVSCASSSCAPHDMRGPAHHGCAVLVGADVLGGPRGRIVHRRRPCAGGGRPRTSAPTMYAALRVTAVRPCTPRLCGVGRGRRPRRPAWTHRPPASSLCVRGAGGRGRPPLPCIRPCASHACAVLRIRPYHVRASARVTARVCAVRGPGDAGAGNGGGSFRSGRCGRACRFPSKGRTGRH